MGGKFNRSARSFANLRYAAACLARDSFSAGSVASLAIRSNWSACSRYSPTIFTIRHPPSNTRSQYGADARGINIKVAQKKSRRDTAAWVPVRSCRVGGGGGPNAPELEGVVYFIDQAAPPNT